MSLLVPCLTLKPLLYSRSSQILNDSKSIFTYSLFSKFNCYHQPLQLSLKDKEKDDSKYVSVPPGPMGSIGPPWIVPFDITASTNIDLVCFLWPRYCGGRFSLAPDKAVRITPHPRPLHNDPTTLVTHGM